MTSTEAIELIVKIQLLHPDPAAFFFGSFGGNGRPPAEEIALSELGIAALKRKAEELGIKRKGVGYPTCCPPAGTKADIILAIRANLGAEPTIFDSPPDILLDDLVLWTPRLIPILAKPKRAPWGDVILYNHYRPNDPGVVLSALSSPSQIEVFTDTFYDADGKLEQNSLWLSRRGDRWRLKLVIEIPDQTELMLSQVTEDETAIRKELKKLEIDLENVPTTASILTLRVTTKNGIVDVARLQDGTYYPVMAIQEPVVCHSDGAFNPDEALNRAALKFSASKTPSKLFAFRGPSVPASKLLTLSVDELPLAMLHRIPDVPKKVWNKRILSQFLPETTASRLCARNARQSLEKNLIAEIQANGIEGAIRALSMDRRAACVMNLVRRLRSSRRGPLRGTVRKWIKQVFGGQFEPDYMRSLLGNDGTSENNTGHKVYKTLEANVFPPGEDGTINDDNVHAVFPDDVILDDSPNTVRFFHGTRADYADAIVARGPRPSVDAYNDFARGFYMARRFEVAASFAVDAASPSLIDGIGDAVVLVLDLDKDW